MVRDHEDDVVMVDDVIVTGTILVESIEKGLLFELKTVAGVGDKPIVRCACHEKKVGQQICFIYTSKEKL